MSESSKGAAITEKLPPNGLVSCVVEFKMPHARKETEYARIFIIETQITKYCDVSSSGDCKSSPKIHTLAHYSLHPS